MSAFSDNFERQVVPRWRESSIAASSPDLQPLRPRTVTPPFETDLAAKLEEFRHTPSVGVAADVATSALLEGNREALDEVAKVILSADSNAPEYLKLIVAKRLEASGDECPVDPVLDLRLHSQKSIANLRQLLKIDPRNPVLLMDLARHQATLGLKDRAEQSARVAVALAPHNRWILRSTTKLLSVHEKADEAHRLLVRSNSTVNDPWLLAAELATAQAADISPKFWRQSKLFLDAKSVGLVHLSELASAVGTMELLEGKIKKAKEHFNLALKSPTDNTLAQVKWAERKIRNGFHIEALFSSVGRAYEAACMSAYNNQDMSRALKLAIRWMDDEPFSSIPSMMASYLASLLDDYDAVIEAAERGLIAAPDDDCMRNNLIFAKLSSGKYLENNEAEIYQWLEEISRNLREQTITNGRDVSHSLANIGLLFYRIGQADTGRKFYDQSVVKAKASKEITTEVNALIFHTREAILARAPWSDELIAQAKKAAELANSPGAKFYIAKLEILAKFPDKAAEILSPIGAAAIQAKLKPAIPSFRIEETPSGLVLWVPRKRAPGGAGYR